MICLDCSGNTQAQSSMCASSETAPKRCRVSAMKSECTHSAQTTGPLPRQIHQLKPKWLQVPRRLLCLHPAELHPLARCPRRLQLWAPYPAPAPVTKPSCGRRIYSVGCTVCKQRNKIGCLSSLRRCRSATSSPPRGARSATRSTRAHVLSYRLRGAPGPSAGALKAQAERG